MPYTPLDVQGSIFQIDVMKNEMGKQMSLGERNQALISAALENKAREIDFKVIELEELVDPQIIRQKEEEAEEQEAKQKEPKLKYNNVAENIVDLKASDYHLEGKEYGKGNFIDTHE